MVTMFLVSDPDAEDTHSFTLLGNPGQKFSLNTQGQLSTAKGILRCPYSCCPIPRKFYGSVSSVCDEQRGFFGNIFVDVFHKY